MQRTVPAVVESGDGSSSTWLGTARSLGRQGVKVVRLSPKNWYSSKYCATTLCPQASREPQAFLTFLVRIGHKLMQKRGRKSVLFPSSDEGLSFIAQNRERLTPYYEPLCPSWEVIQWIVDKHKTYGLAEKLGIPIPATYTPNNLSEVIQIAKKSPYPCLLKPIYSHLFWPKYKSKLIEVHSKQELLTTYRHFPGVPFLIQEEILGPDDHIYHLNTSFNKNSEPLAIFTGRKLRQCPPQFGVGSFVESVWEPKVAELGIKLLKNLHFYGIAEVEFKKDARTGEFKLIEINGRSGTQNYLATICGINTAYISYQEAIGERPKPLRTYTCQYDLDIKWIHLSLDLLSILKKRTRNEITLAAWLRSILVGKKVFAIFSVDDLRPFLSEIKNSLVKLHYKQIS